ncbi:hypothetical protein K3495_g2394 [Podosphaera aphanis]|nr:hypothetical protein K3495_g2394 [Podosphaera aphanis]
MDGLLQAELAPVREVIPILSMNWMRRSVESDELFGYVRICVPESKASRFPSRLRIYGEAVSIQKIWKRQQIVVCTKCYGFMPPEFVHDRTNVTAVALVLMKALVSNLPGA